MGERLREVAEGRPRAAAFTSLSSAEKEAACAEFVRERPMDRADLPILKRLLLPVGRSLEDIDVYGVADDGALVYAQVTNHPVTSAQAREKATRLGTYRDAYRAASHNANADVRGTGIRLVFFGVGEGHIEPEDVLFASVDGEVEP